MKRFFNILAALTVVGILAVNADARWTTPRTSTANPNSYLGLTGELRVYTSTGQNTPAFLVIGSTNGLWTAYGIRINTASMSGLLSGTSAQFSSWVSFMSSINVTGLLSGASAYVYGTVTSTTGFVGDGNKLSNLASSAWISTSNFQSEVFTAHMASVTARFSSVIVATDSLRAGINVSTPALAILIATSSVLASNTNYINTSSQLQNKNGTFTLNSGSIAFRSSVGDKFIGMHDVNNALKISLGEGSGAGGGELYVNNSAGNASIKLVGSGADSYFYGDGSGNRIGVNTTDPKSMLQLHEGSMTVTGSKSGIALSTVTLGTGGRIVFSDGSVQTTAPTAGGVTNSTVPIFSIGGGGDVFMATNNFCPVQGGCDIVSQATMTTATLQPYTIFPSTVGFTEFYLVKATATTSGIFTAWTRVSPRLEVSTGQVYGPIISTAIAFNANEAYSVQISSYAVTGQQAAQFGIKGRGWFNPYP